MTGRQDSGWITGWWPMPALTGVLAGAVLAVLATTTQAGRVPLPSQILLPAPTVGALTAAAGTTATPTAARPTSGAASRSTSPPPSALTADTAPTPSRSTQPTTSTGSAPASEQPTVRVMPPSHPVVEAPDEASSHDSEGTGGDGG